MGKGLQKRKEGQLEVGRGDERRRERDEQRSRRRSSVREREVEVCLPLELQGLLDEGLGSNGEEESVDRSGLVCERRKKGSQFEVRTRRDETKRNEPAAVLLSAR